MNRPVILRLLATAVLLAIAAIGWPLMRKNPPASSSPSPAATSGHSRPGPTSSGTARHQPDPDAAYRKKQLADLIRRWNLLPANPGETVIRELSVFGTATVPEPASCALAGLGALALIARRRR